MFTKVFSSLILAACVAASPISEAESSLTKRACPAIPNTSNYNFQYLTDPFTFADGSKVTTKEDWQCRRDEIYQFIQQYELGDFPTPPSSATTATMNGNSISITVNDQGRSISFSVSVSYPSGGSAPYPAIIAYGYPSIPIPAGVATITFNNDDIAAQQGTQSRGQGKFYQIYGSSHSAGATTAWAWGVGRIIDAIEKLPNSRINPERIGVTGCSRNGKGAFIAGVLEQRVALTLPQESGSGGTNTWRISDSIGSGTQTARQIVGENCWFSSRFNTYAQSSVNRMPFDHHLMAALVAPRGLFVIDQTAILWLGAQSSFGSMMAGREVYKALGVASNLGFHQSGGHNHCQFPGEQTNALNSFINRFLLDQSVSTDITYTAGGYNNNWPGQWTPWTTPTLS